LDGGDMRLVLAAVKTQSWRTSWDLWFRKLMGDCFFNQQSYLVICCPWGTHVDPLLFACRFSS
jgi:hypothetical protein